MACPGGGGVAIALATAPAAGRPQDPPPAAPAGAGRIRLALVGRSRATRWAAALVAAVLVCALAPYAQAHTLSLRRVRSGGSPHSVSCSWRFRRLNPSSGTASICGGTVRVYLFGGSLRLHRTIVRPRRCVFAPV